jgi:phosphoadenosine phosphosulfate reductase
MDAVAMKSASEKLEGKPPLEVLKWAAAQFPNRLTFATGFGLEGCVIIDLIGRHQLSIDIFTLDTGLLFGETYDLWKKLEARYGITIRAVKPALTVEEQAKEWGDKLWERDADRCCDIRKVLPLKPALEPFAAWVTAIRRDQTPDRANAQVVEPDKKFSLVKVNPLLKWSSADVANYVKLNDVPYNVLHDRNYPSIGCWPCTSPVKPGEDPRAGRWRGKAKTECGLHKQEEPNANEVERKV